MTEVVREPLATWNAPQQVYPQDKCVPQLVAAQAAATPDEVALIMGDRVLSYGELNRRANQLAYHLQMLGVQRDVLVGLCIERSLDMAVGLLGILKAGGAYMPLDPAYPPERLAFMLEDAQASVLVTQQHLTTRLPAHSVRMVYLDSDKAILERQSETDPVSLATINDLAYVIYTSGSTGQPKGVGITHDSLLNLVFWHQRAFAVTSSDRATQVASPAFDAMGWELWPYLTIGASVYLPDEDTRANPVLLRDWLVNNSITVTFLPTLLAEHVMALEWSSTTSLRLLLTGADMLHYYPPPTLPFAVVNNYGPTEATVVTTSGLVFPTAHAAIPPSIGRPIANTQIYILDEHLQQVPVGETGELCIGGAGLAKGYLHRPELTSEKFIAHPFSHDPSARLYRTGDLARYLPDGQIAFMGRTDHQVKIRGFRVELGEIEAILHQHPAVHQAVVTTREDVSGENRLVAYVVIDHQVHSTEQHPFVSVAELQRFLQARLPDYMVPTVFVQLDTLPMTINGKVDRAVLPAPDAANTLRDDVFVAPNTLTEEHLRGIVAALLNLDPQQIGIDDNFFLLGGNSLMGTQVIVRVAETFGVGLSLRALFDAPAIRQLSAEIERLIVAKVMAMSDDEVLHLLGSGPNV